MDAFYSGGIPAVGFCDVGVIGLANFYTDRAGSVRPSSDMKRTMLHESLHAAGRDRGFFLGYKRARISPAHHGGGFRGTCNRCGTYKIL